VNPDASLSRALQLRIRDVPDHPKAGIVFKDITPVLADPALFGRAVEALAEPWRSARIDKVLAIEARGFLIGAPVALALHAGCVPVRKPGKLPWRTLKERYALEYGEDALEVHVDSIQPGDRVLVVDDLLATGGTAGAAARLVERCGGELVGFGFIVWLSFLPGMSRLGPERVRYLVGV
jgi:adenine phosphoribosyltransferase